MEGFGLTGDLLITRVCWVLRQEIWHLLAELSTSAGLRRTRGRGVEQLPQRPKWCETMPVRPMNGFIFEGLQVSHSLFSRVS